MYKKWFKETNPKILFKKVPKPSETRWAFYRNVLDSVLFQAERIEEFLQQDSEFHSFRQRLQYLNQVDPRNPSSFFSHHFVLSLFKFSFFILDKIWTLVVQMQHQYTILPLVWTSVERLRNEFVKILDDIHNRRLAGFDYLRFMDETQIVTFENVLKQLILNMHIRFPCPSTGIDTRHARRHTDIHSATLNDAVLKSYMRKCPLFLNVGIFLFPDDLIRRRTINTFFLSGRFPEIPRIASEIIQKEALIWETFHTTTHQNDGSGEQNIPVTLLDVFKVIEPNNFPFLWDVVLKTVTLMPTSVSCEQSFSRLRNKMRENMKMETSFHFVAVTHKNQIRFFRE